MAEANGAGRADDWSQLPQNLLYEILTRVPFDSLHFCRLACSSWRRVTNEPSFISLHRHRTNTFTDFFAKSTKRNPHPSGFTSLDPCPSSSIPPPSLDFLPYRDARILSASHHGILFCQATERQQISTYYVLDPYTKQFRKAPKRPQAGTSLYVFDPATKQMAPRRSRVSSYYVCNPATRQFRVIPSPKTKFRTKAAAVVAGCSSGTALQFKIVRLSEYPRKDDSYTIWEVFSSRTGRWRRCREKIPNFSLSPSAGMEADNVLYWLVDDGKSVFAFDVEREEWSLIPLPEDEGKARTDDKLVVDCEGRLCLIRAARRGGDGDCEVELWAMVDETAGEWKSVRSERVVFGPGESVQFLTSIWEALWCV